MAARRPEGAVAIRLSEQSDVLPHGAPLVTLANRTGSTVRNRDISRCVAADDGGRWSCASLKTAPTVAFSTPELGSVATPTSALRLSSSRRRYLTSLGHRSIRSLQSTWSGDHALH